VLACGGVHGELCGTADEAGFEHEGEGAFEFHRLQFSSAGAGEGLGVGTVAAHAVVQAGSSGGETLGLGVVFALDEAHELVHEVAMEPGRPEGVFGDDPARREDGEVDVGRAGDLAGRGEDGVDGWVGVVEADGVDAVEAGEVVLAGGVVAVPCDDVERGMVEVGSPIDCPGILRLPGSWHVSIVVGGVWSEEVAAVGEAVRSDGAEFGEPEAGAVVFEEVAAGLRGFSWRREEFDAELDAAGDEGDLAGGKIEYAEFGVEHQAAQLWDEEQFAIGGVEEAVGHAFVGCVDVDRVAGVHTEVAAAGQCGQAVDKVGWLGGQRERVPTELAGRGFDFVEGGRADEAVWRCARRACA